MKLNIRKLKDSDWDTLVELWDAWPDWKQHPTSSNMMSSNKTQHPPKITS